MADDLGSTYMANRQDLQKEAAASELLSRYPDQGEVAPAAPAQTDTSQKPGIAKRVAKDVGGGIVETPLGIVGGIRDAYQSTINGAADLGLWLEKKGNLPGLKIDSSGVHIASGEEMQQLQAQGKRPFVGKELPDSELLHPKTVTGGLVHGTAQFITSMANVGKMFGLAGDVTEGGALVNHLYTAGKGAAAMFAGFEGGQKRLSDLIESVPALQNPVTDFLSSKPDDNEAVGRLKNAAEGVIGGELLDGFVRSLKLLKAGGEASTALKAAPDAAPEMQAAAAPVERPNGMKMLGDESPTAPLLSDKPIGQEFKPTALGNYLRQQQAERTTSGVMPEQISGAEMPETPKTYINFARINSPEDLEAVTQQMADKFSDGVKNAQRGTQTFEQIKLNSEMENAFSILNQRRTGEPLNAEQSVAVRELWAASADKLKQTADLAVASPTDENLFAFRKMAATHYAIQNQVIGARTETARALASWRIPVEGTANRLQEITDRLVELGGGTDNIKTMAQKVSGLANANMPHELEQFIGRSAYAKTRDALIQAWTDGLLSSPVTQAKILASNVTTGIWRMGERKLAEKISAIRGTENGVALGETAAQWSGITNGWKDALAYAWKAAKTQRTGEGIGEPHEPYPSKISAEALELSDQGWLGKGADLLGTVIGLGRRGVAAQHDPALTHAYRMELNAQAVRTATQELNSGELAGKDFNSRVADIVANPPPNVRMDSVSGARYQAFLDEPGAIAQKLIEIRQEVPAVRAILPFIKIPARIFSYSMERTPLAPLMAKFRNDMAAGGARQDLALAQTGLGTGIMLAVADMTMAGRIKAQGPAEIGLQQAQEREGERNWTAKIGDKWFDYNGIHPIGKIIGLSAAVTEAITNGQHELKDDADTEKLAVATSLAIAANLTNASYTQGLTNFFAMMHDNRVGGTGEGALFSTAGSVVPAVVARSAMAVDPYQRAVYSMMDEWKSKIPGLSKDLPPRRDLWGRPVASGAGPFSDMLSPAQYRNEDRQPIDDEMLKQGFNIPMPSTTQSFGRGASIDMKHYPKAYSRFLELAGHAYKDPAWDQGALDTLNDLVTGKHPLSPVYEMQSDGPDGMKEEMVRGLINRYRDGSRRQLLDEFPDLKREVDQKQEAAQALKMPTMQ